MLVIFMNSVHISIYAIGVPLVLSYIRGWDFCGTFIGVYRSPILDALIFLQAISQSSVIFVKKNTVTFYALCCPKRNKPVTTPTTMTTTPRNRAMSPLSS